MSLKIQPQHLQHLRDSVAKFDTDFHRSRYAAAGLSDERFHWDMLQAAGCMPFVCGTLYTYLNDSHISSAMCAIVKPLERNA